MIILSTTNLANVNVKHKIKKMWLTIPKKGYKNRTHSGCGFEKVMYNGCKDYCCLSASIALA